MNYMFTFHSVRNGSLGVLNAPIRAGTILKCYATKFDGELLCKKTQWVSWFIQLLELNVI